MQSDLDPVMAAAVEYLAPTNRDRRNDSSATWTTSSGEMGLFPDHDEVEDRVHFVDEYNRLAKKHSIRLLVKEDLDTCPEGDGSANQEEKLGWFRTFLRDVSGSSHVSSIRSVRKVSSKRSLSDIASHLIHPKRDGLKDENLQTLVRLCGKSKLYLPSEYAPASLILPTCFRATAQYLVKHGTNTRSIFRMPGSARVVAAIYDHYCPTKAEADVIDTTVCSPNLPSHFNANVHDVASVFKKFLTCLPGGILGSLALFDGFVAIHSQLHGDPESPRTKRSKLRARLIALAIGTVRSQHRRELICAVFGVLSLIGRTAELAPREDKYGKPLPTSDLMGYQALGDVFGPLLIGNLLDSYTMKLVNSNQGLILLPVSPPRSRKDRSGRRSKAADEHQSPAIEVDKIHVASHIVEMVITHWREVVKHLRSLGALRTHRETATTEQSHANRLRSSASESPVIGQPEESGVHQAPSMHTASTLPRRRSFSGFPEPAGRHFRAGDVQEPLFVKRRRPKSGRTTSNNRVMGKAPHPVLSPTAEESGSPFSQAAREVANSMPSVDQHLAAALTQASHEDAEHLTPSRDKPAQKHRPSAAMVSPSHQNKGSKNGSLRATLPRSTKESQHTPVAEGNTAELSASGRTPTVASSKLIRGVFSGATGLADVFNTPPTDRAGATSPSRIPTPQGSLRRRLKKRRSPEASALCGHLTQANNAGASGEHTRPSAAQKVNNMDKPQAQREEGPPAGEDGHDPTSQKASGALLSSINPVTALSQNGGAKDLVVSRPPVQAAESHTANNVAETKTFQDKQDSSYFPSSNHNQSDPIVSDIARRRTASSAVTTTEHENDTVQPGDCNRNASAQQKSSPEALSDQNGQDNNYHSKSVHRLSHAFKRIRRSSTVTPTTTTTRSVKADRRSSNPGTSRPCPFIKDDRIRSPGIMTPYMEGPPVAQHLSRRLPPRSATSSRELLPTPATPGPNSNAALYAQVLTLQRQLAARNEEIAHLRRQLDAVGEGGAGTLSERVRVAGREAQMWKERAIAAERRVLVFERFLRRVKRLGDKRGVHETEELAVSVGDGTEADVEKEMMAMDGAGGSVGLCDGVIDGVTVEDTESNWRDSSIWMAAREMVEYDDMRRWMNGSFQGCY